MAPIYRLVMAVVVIFALDLYVAVMVVLRALLSDFGLQFQPVSFDASFGSGSAPLFDMIFGMAFCK